MKCDEVELNEVPYVKYPRTLTSYSSEMDFRFTLPPSILKSENMVSSSSITVFFMPKFVVMVRQLIKMYAGGDPAETERTTKLF